MGLHLSQGRIYTAISGLACLLLISTTASAGDYYSSVPFLPTVKINPDGEGATKPELVYGKEYSHTNWMRAVSLGLDPNIVNVEDHDAFGTPKPLQVVSWDGRAGGPEGNSGSVNGFDYGSSPGFNYPRGQVDALANHGDFLFDEVVRNQATLLFSVTADMGISGSPKAHIHFEDPDPVSAADTADVWAVFETGSAGPGAGPGVNHHAVYDLDALEVWGPEPPSHDPNHPTGVKDGYFGGFPGPNTADADRFSLDNDAANGGVSVWAYDIGSTAISPWVLHSDIVKAVEKLFLPDGYVFDPETRNRVDVDATMAKDMGDASPTAALWSPGDELLFSIDPIIDGTMLDPTGSPSAAPLIDGGEIMHLVNAAAGMSISFLEHGGHKWDTAFSVSSTFGYEFEDIDALEAVGVLEGTDIQTPEPSTWVMCGLAVVLAGGYLRRRD